MDDMRHHTEYLIQNDKFDNLHSIHKTITPDQELFFYFPTQKTIDIFLLFLMKTYVVGTR